MPVLAVTLRQFQIAALQSLGVDVEGVDPDVEVAVQAENETGVDVHGGVSRPLDVAPVHAVDAFVVNPADLPKGVLLGWPVPAQLAGKLM